MNEIINNRILTGYEFIPELDLKQSGFTYNACVTFTKHRECFQKIVETGNLKQLYQKE